MAHNPYQAPATAVADPLEPAGMPQTMERDIRNGWIAAVVSASVTLAFTVLAIAGTSLYEFDAWASPTWDWSSPWPTASIAAAGPAR